MAVTLMVSIAVGFISNLVKEARLTHQVIVTLLDLQVVDGRHSLAKYHYDLPNILQSHRTSDRTCHQAIEMKLSTAITPWCSEANKN